MPTDPQAVKNQVRLRLDELRRQSYEQLASLPVWSKTTVSLDNSSAELVTNREGSVGQDLVIVVQCFPEGSRRRIIWQFYRWVGVYAEGFRISPSGVSTDLSDGERLAYM
jgi:hypothetical protein